MALPLCTCLINSGKESLLAREFQVLSVLKSPHQGKAMVELLLAERDGGGRGGWGGQGKGGEGGGVWWIQPFNRLIRLQVSSSLTTSRVSSEAACCTLADSPLGIAQTHTSTQANTCMKTRKGIDAEVHVHTQTKTHTSHLSSYWYTCYYCCMFLHPDSFINHRLLLLPHKLRTETNKKT